MQQFRRFSRIILCSLLVIVLVGWSVVLSASGEYQITWWTVNSGGGISNGGEYQLHGTSGQSDVGTSLQGGTYRLHGGFWHALATPRTTAIYLPLIMAATPAAGQPDLVGELRFLSDQTSFGAGGHLPLSDHSRHR
ncbi:MAG: hypothetical protein AAGF95_16345 [Chloroflexota bacterium]